MNFARNSKHNIKIDFEKSHGSYLFDKNTKREYLDFFGMYASLPLGYNHSIFKSEKFKKDFLNVSSFKVNNCEFTSDEALEFDRLFSNYAGLGLYNHFHYCCTGALAIEAAIKVCIHHSGYKFPNILCFDNSFHGINSYGGFITDNTYPAASKLKGFPQIFQTRVPFNLEIVEKKLKFNDITCVLVEPIQCSAGDIHHDKEFFTSLREICNKYDVPLIFDEVQIGFGSTGKLWYFQNLGIVPDIVVFGKKTQLSGIMVLDKVSGIFSRDNVTKLEVTWDSDIVDMVRCKYIIQEYERSQVIENCRKIGKYALEELKKISALKNVRGSGLILGFCLDSQEYRDIFIKKLKECGMIVNATGEKSIRLRPALNITGKDVETALHLIKEAL